MSNGEKAYGWDKIVVLGPDNANMNADTYAFLALLAKLADRGFRLSMGYEEAFDGQLFYAPDLIPVLSGRRGRRRERRRRRLDFAENGNETTVSARWEEMR